MDSKNKREVTSFQRWPLVVWIWRKVAMPLWRTRTQKAKKEIKWYPYPIEKLTVSPAKKRIKQLERGKGVECMNQHRCLAGSPICQNSVIMKVCLITSWALAHSNRCIDFLLLNNDKMQEETHDNHGRNLIPDRSEAGGLNAGSQGTNEAITEAKSNTVTWFMRWVRKLRVLM